MILPMFNRVFFSLLLVQLNAAYFPTKSPSRGGGKTGFETIVLPTLLVMFRLASPTQTSLSGPSWAYVKNEK